MCRILLFNIFICIACNEHPGNKNFTEEDFKMNFYSRKGELIKSLSADDLRSVDMEKQHYVFRQPDSLRKVFWEPGSYLELLYNGKVFIKASIFYTSSSEAIPEESPVYFTSNGHILNSDDTLRLFHLKKRIIDSSQIKKLDSFFRSKNIITHN